jgi:hypothetical protein
MLSPTTTCAALLRALAPVAVALAIATPLHAQLGDPFTPATFESAMKGLKVMQARGNELAALRTQYLNAQNRRSKLLEDNERAIEAFEVNDRKVRDCTSEQLNSNSPERQQMLQQKMMAMMSDPVAANRFAQDYQRLLEISTKAAQANDTAAMAKANADILKLYGVDAKADSAAAAVKCGALPRKPAALLDADAQSRRADSLATTIRRVESLADIEAARAAGVDPARFLQMRERLQTFISKPSALTAQEIALLTPRKAEIQALLAWQ